LQSLAVHGRLWYKMESRYRPIEETLITLLSAEYIAVTVFKDRQLENYAA